MTGLPKLESNKYDIMPSSRYHFLSIRFKVGMSQCLEINEIEIHNTGSKTSEAIGKKKDFGLTYWFILKIRLPDASSVRVYVS